MDLSMLKQKLDTLQQKTPAGGQKRDYSLTFWRPTVGKQQIRIVPSAYNPKNPFSELKFYYGITNKVMISPLNFGEKDPIALFAKKLREEYSKENYLLAKKLDAKTRIFAPVIVRGEEDKGVRLWQFGKLIYEELLSLAVDEEIGDYTDIVNGRDLTIETVGPEATGTQYNKSSVRVRLKQTPLSSDAELVEKWKTTQPDPTAEFKRFTFEEMKSALEKWLAPEDAAEEGDIVSEPAVDFDSEAPKSKFSLDTSKAKQNKNDEFDELFDNKNDSKVDDFTVLDMARKKKSLSAAVSKEIQSKFDLNAFKNKKGLDKNIKFKEQDWIPLSKAFQDVTSIPGIPMGHIVLLRGHSDTGKTTAMIEAAVSAQKRNILPVFYYY